MTEQFAGKVAWITGASSGIGAALARAWSDAGAHIVLSGRDEARLAQVAKDCATDTLVLPFDVRDDAAMRAACEQAVGWKQGVDIFVANAGISQRSRATETAMEVYRNIIEPKGNFVKGLNAGEFLRVQDDAGTTCCPPSRVSPAFKKQPK